MNNVNQIQNMNNMNMNNNNNLNFYGNNNNINNNNNFNSVQNNNGNNIFNNKNNLINNKIYSKNTDKNIFLTFTFEKYNKQIYIDINENDTFNNIIIELEEKYNWLKGIQNKTYLLNDKEIKKDEFSKTGKILGIVDNTNIVIIV